ncbi:hypothetical protein LTR62_004623 [Meristemomyces frigidus]|uniref:RNA-dependent RNA polymerase n=1 Tax=Meristemomyces frigidus TaxID=1508187 RepID=A0AAN7TLU4_9PEZI|nr:hypothetical protein LTR62_004623 [Meristemomyces frigidus]
MALRRSNIDFTGHDSVKISIRRLPDKNWSTWDAYKLFSPYGNVSRIELFWRSTGSASDGYVIFRPPPRLTTWIRHGLIVGAMGRKMRMEFNVSLPPTPASTTSLGMVTETITMPCETLDSGILRSKNSLARLFACHATGEQAIDLIVHPGRRRVELIFHVVEIPENQRRANHESRVEKYKITIDMAQLKSVRVFRTPKLGAILLFDLAMPPLLHRQTTDIEATHDPTVSRWNDWQAWYRQTIIGKYSDVVGAATQLRTTDPLLDIGRWLTYAVSLNEQNSCGLQFDNLGKILRDNNIDLVSGLSRDQFITTDAEEADIWSWSHGSGGPSSALHAMMQPVDNLEFGVRYQLEVCLSLNKLRECDIDSLFLEKLASLEPARAVGLLTKVADTRSRIFDPMSIFSSSGQIKVAKSMPAHYTTIPSAVITPTTIYFTTPVMETSNRVIRANSEAQDRFLRVKFTDERYKGRIMNADDATEEEVFARIKRTMTYGINVGNRHYEFLAFGNSQFRECGAYFFAPGNNKTAASIRATMGEFEQLRDIDRNVAKYASRLGQCFSTTRGMSIAVKIDKLVDVYSGSGDCFTDGVGKISPFLAQMVAQEHDLPGSAAHQYPSVLQFRIGGCKGVLAVDPSIMGCKIGIRPSQEKFSAKYHGLEICRYSRFTAAYLNVQIILVLNALGVSSNVFIHKMRSALSDLAEVQTNPKKALEQLCKNVDFNHTTLVLAEMIYDGFMGAQEPFMMSCLQLWRSWTIKYLKEKAKILVEQGAFVLGCTDETQTLRGHIDAELSADGQPIDPATLPEIFLQIPDSEVKGKYKVILGVCSLARNPSLHPGDIRVVRAVDVPALHHLRDCVVLPQKGDRGLASMCSGGDLDGDDYLVMWDPDLLPLDWNYTPMDYQAPAPIVCDQPVTVDDLTSFFVTHIRHDNLARIAVAHKYWADSQECPDGVKDEKCIELAKLHSKAVDYAKTGVAAEFPKRLRVKRWPHWAEKEGKPQYRSRKVLGRLYDEVQRVPFVPDWSAPFDTRIHSAQQVDREMLDAAREVKAQYDDAMRRIMAQYSIESEFEVWTTFVLKHSNEEGDYKFSERLGDTVSVLKETYQEICCDKAGTTRSGRDWAKLRPFIIAMYTVTTDEVSAAVQKAQQTCTRDGRSVPLAQPTFAEMPLMSFPWIFAKELGYIAKGQTPGCRPNNARPLAAFPKRQVQKKKTAAELFAAEGLEPLPEVRLEGGVVQEGEVLAVHQQGSESAMEKLKPERSAVVEAEEKADWEGGEVVTIKLDDSTTIDGLDALSKLVGYD